MQDTGGIKLVVTCSDCGMSVEFPALSITRRDFRRKLTSEYGWGTEDGKEQQTCPRCVALAALKTQQTTPKTAPVFPVKPRAFAGTTVIYPNKIPSERSISAIILGDPREDDFVRLHNRIYEPYDPTNPEHIEAERNGNRNLRYLIEFFDLTSNMRQVLSAFARELRAIHYAQRDWASEQTPVMSFGNTTTGIFVVQATRYATQSELAAAEKAIPQNIDAIIGRNYRKAA